MPRLTYIDASGSVVRKEFTDVDVRTNDWAHLVLTHTGTDLKMLLKRCFKANDYGRNGFPFQHDKNASLRRRCRICTTSNGNGEVIVDKNNNVVLIIPDTYVDFSNAFVKA